MVSNAAVTLGSVVVRAVPTGYVPMHTSACGHTYWVVNGLHGMAVRAFGGDKGVQQPQCLALAAVWYGRTRYIYAPAWQAWGKASTPRHPAVLPIAMDNAAYALLVTVLDKGTLQHMCKACNYVPVKQPAVTDNQQA